MSIGNKILQINQDNIFSSIESGDSYIHNLTCMFLQGAESMLLGNRVCSQTSEQFISK